jgi:hypothetical protein
MSSFQALSSKRNAAMPFAHQGSDPTLSKSAKMMAKAAHSDGGGPSMARQGGGGGVGGGGGGGSFKRPSSTLPEVKRPANASAKRPSTVDPGAAVSTPLCLYCTAILQHVYTPQLSPHSGIIMRFSQPSVPTNFPLT